MKEALFVKQNSEKWKGYEAMRTNNPDELAHRFIDITNDLAYAKTFYPKSRTTSYLNGIASVLHQAIYKNKKEESGRFVHFWKYELSIIFYKHRRQLLYSLIFFVISCAIGILSAKYDTKFLRMFFGDNYVNMINENIAKGNPFGVYKSQGEMQMFFQLATNNVWVMLIMFVSGIFLSIGPVFYLLRTGIMIGAFEYFFLVKVWVYNPYWLFGSMELWKSHLQ